MNRRKKKTTNPSQKTITEPVRLSLFDVLQTNLKIAKRVTYVHRILYIGEHNFIKGDVSDAFDTNCKLTNAGFCREPLSGILLHYKTYLCVIAEGSEESIHKHLSLLFQHHRQDLSNMKLLSTVHHIKGRFLNEWMSYYGRPHERVEQIDSALDLDTSMQYVTECCEKLYNFAGAFIKDQMRLRHLVSDEDIESIPTVKQRSRSIVERDPYTLHLPEIKLLEFLTQCNHLKTLEQFFRYYEYIGQSKDFSLKSWPAPKNFVPYDIFDEKYDPISDLPLKKEQIVSKMEITSDQEL